jgi:hypothetical protein
MGRGAGEGQDEIKMGSVREGPGSGRGRSFSKVYFPLKNFYSFPRMLFNLGKK